MDGSPDGRSERPNTAPASTLSSTTSSPSPFCFLLSSYPGLASRHGVALAVLFGGPVIYLLVSWLLTRRLLMFHFWSAKAGALLLFALWPLLYLTGWEALIPLAATVVGLSRLEQVIFILRGGVDQDAPHMFASVERSHE